MHKHRIIRLVVAFGIGIALALVAYQRAMNPLPTLERRQEEAVVLHARAELQRYVALSPQLEIVDPLAQNRAAGKVYIYPAGNGWQVSGHYRRPGERRFRPWLMTLDAERRMTMLRVRDGDPAIQARAAADARFDAAPD